MVSLVRLVVNSRRSVIIADLWRPEVARPGNFVIHFWIFINDTLWQNFQNSVPKGYIVTPIEIVVWKFGKVYLTGNRKNRYLREKKNKISPASQNVATVRIALQICHGQPPTMCSQCSRFNPNRSTFVGVLAERVNIVYLPRRVPISIIRRKLCFGRVINNSC